MTPTVSHPSTEAQQASFAAARGYAAAANICDVAHKALWSAIETMDLIKPKPNDRYEIAKHLSSALLSVLSAKNALREMELRHNLT